MKKIKVNLELKRSDDNIMDSSGKVHYPDSFTLALSYLPDAETYASLITTPMPFNELLAEILAQGVNGTKQASM